MSVRPNIIFCNLSYSGSSAIDPILRDLLRALQYDLIPVYPHNTAELPNFLGGEQPIYHWTHDPVATYADLMASGNYKFLYLYRDPRDVLVSMTKDPLRSEQATDQSEKQLLMGLMEQALPSLLADACRWVRLDKALCFPFTFEEMKRDIPDMMRRIFAFLQLPIDEALLVESAQRHSFEAVTGRQRGEEGPTVRTGYLYRKGISGGWKRHFDGELLAQFKRRHSASLAELGYEPDNDWGYFSPVVQFVLSAGVPEAQALADTLCASLQSVEDSARPEIVCVSDLLALCHPDRPTIVITDTRELSAKDREDLADYEREEAFLGLPPAEAAVYSTLLWQGMPLLVVPLREVCSCPQDALRRILRFLDLSCTEAITAEWMRRMSNRADSETATVVPYNPARLRQVAMKTYSTYAMKLPLAVSNSLFQAEMQLKAGGVGQALSDLRSILNEENLSPDSYIAALCCHAAMRWVQTLFTESEAHTLAATVAFPLLRDLNAHLLARAGVQQALIGTLALPDPAMEAHYFTRLGEALFALEEWTGAETALLQGLERQPESPLIYSDLAVLCWQQGRRTQSIAHLETALQLDPSHHCALANARALGVAIHTKERPSSHEFKNTGSVADQSR